MSIIHKIPIIKAREKLTSLPEELEQNPGAITVTRHGEPVLAILPWALYESLVETLEILGDEELMAALRRSIREADEGKAISWKRAKKEL